MRFFWLFITSTITISSIVGEESSEPNYSVFAETLYGQVEGEVLVLADNFKVNIFQGIPYAKPPLRELRFRPPTPPDRWHKVLRTTKFQPACVQTHVMTDMDMLKTIPFKIEQSEDCLYLNVFAPAEKSKDFGGYPVMFMVHGGAFNTGGVLSFGTRKITERFVPTGIVFVSIAYRLGPYGFLSTGDSEAPGNYGMLDMVAALEWVKANINSFGGDPGRVTVFGESAGSAATSLLTLSPLSRDLFHQAIMSSGAATASWCVAETSAPATFKLAEVLQCDLPSNAQMLDCLRTKTVPEIQAAYLSFMNLTASKIIDFTIVVDGYFLPKPVLELYNEAPKKRYMAGTNANESGFFVEPVFPFIKHMGMTKNESDFTYKQFKETITSFIPDGEFKNADLLRRLTFHHYLHSKGDKKDVSFLFKQYSQVLDDLLFQVPQYSDASNRAKAGSDVWLYSFNWYDDRVFRASRKNRGVYHAAELQYLFDVKWNPSLQDNEETMTITDIFITMFTNFAKYGNPTPTEVPYGRWEKLTAEHPWRHYSITPNPGMSTSEFHKSTVEFWTQLLVDIEKMSAADAKLEVTRHEEL